MLSKDSIRLMELQEQYLNGSLNAWRDLWLLSYDISRRFVAHYAKLRRLRLSADEVHDIAISATCGTLSRFKNPKHPGFRFKSNLNGYLFLECKHFMQPQNNSEKLYLRINKVAGDINANILQGWKANSKVAFGTFKF